jgi:hypothetical protein
MDGESIGLEGANSDAVVIHFSDHFPVIGTACGVVAPSAADWTYVDCPACIEMRAAYREVDDERHGPNSSSWRAAPSTKSAARRREPLSDSHAQPRFEVTAA